MGVFDLILGPILMGTQMNVLLMGIMIVQCYVYFERYKGDKPWIKATVWLLLLLDLLSSSFAMAMTYNYLVTNFGNIPAIQVTNTGIDPYPLLTGITALVVQTFFAWRIHVLTKNKLLAIIIAALSIIQMLASLGTMIGGLIVKDFVKLEQIKQISLIWLFGSVITDVIITVSLVRILSKKKTGFASTDHLISKIIRSTVQTGLLTTTFALGVVIAYLVSDSTMHLAFGLPLSKLYTNTLLSSLNARSAWSPEGYTTASHTAIQLPTGSGSQAYNEYSINTTNGIAVNVSKSSHTQTDSSSNEIHEMKTYKESPKHLNIV
ncbi:uncharacterized protein EV420DRAFT_343673 [Desarmillaria tabescens]|uniref:DUF6534 domain-containing protein n=1 Tax=Armillaria tabescens TaxID=1929756 RepID=A0AA39N6D5_ARMTA|nr:uncharacterized protein EV420DRAFT_343673 [Desarmillaria tabescens]KAK0458975.1 hypothetical protein EV420DRAFT_343673 [Desarmillaria tabescens]